ncbi:MAG TPA: outer membrane beta-barrel protein, partial [Candidatus Dojkabacteria bacterium]|nr:outer membrane beta-barrel protein [Candidatus Dojkabacteria bacterium]
MQKTSSDFYWYGLSAKHLFFKKKASIVVSAYNPFTKGVNQKVIQTGSDFISEGNFRTLNRSISLSVEWRFGQTVNSNRKQL